jgi:hypothetical protein
MYIALFSILLLAIVGDGFAAATYTDATGTHHWRSAGNWDPIGVPYAGYSGAVTIGKDVSTYYCEIDAAQTADTLYQGNAGGTSTLDVIAGSLAVTGNYYSGHVAGATAICNISGTAWMYAGAYASTYTKIGEVGVGKLNVSGSGYYTSYKQLYLAPGASSSGSELNISGTGTVKVLSNMYVASGGNATITISGGHLLVNPGGYNPLWLGSATGKTGTMNLSGTGDVNTANGDFELGHVSGSTGILNMTGGTMTVGNLKIGAVTGATGYVHLDGGSIYTRGTLIMTSGGHLDIREGSINLPGTITNITTFGNVTAYDGGGVFQYTYGGGRTTVTAYEPTIYILDLQNAGVTNAEKYDIRHVAVCIQGLANRKFPRVLVNYDRDNIFVDQLLEPGGLCEGWDVNDVANVHDLLGIFRNYVSGVVLYDASPYTGVNSTSLVATTVAGVEGAIAVRKDGTAGSMYNYLVNDSDGPHLPVIIDLTGKFTGTGTIWQTSTASTGSKKCDAYIWAKEKYIDTGKCDPTVLSYTMDLWGLRSNVIHLHTQVFNLDYAISKKGFCFDLSPWSDEKPNDDLNQPLGADFNTFKAILNACNTQTGRTRMIRLCGYINWLYKYSNYTGVGGSHTPLAGEAAFTNLVTAYNTCIEADALDPSYISNASFYSRLSPEFTGRRYVQNPAPTYNNMVSRGLIDGSGNVVAGNYILVGLGDYDSASWVLYGLDGDAPWGRYLDSNRGQVYCNWGINPNEIERASVAVDYMYRHKTAKDCFMSWDNGAGKLTVRRLYGSRTPSGYPSAVSMWQEHCKKYYRLLDYSISGWLQGGTSPDDITLTDVGYWTPFSGDGIGISVNSAITSPSLVNNIPLLKREWYEPDSSNLINYPTGVHFSWCRTVSWTPTQVKALETAWANSGHNHRFLDAYTFYYLLRYYLGGNNNYRATWVSDTIPKMMVHGTTYPVTVTVRNDGWDTWSESSSYRLAHAVVARGGVPNYDVSPRHLIPSGNIAPGQSVVFSFSITAPSTIGNYDLYYDMVREGVTWFRSKNNIEWKKDIIVN